MTRQQFAGCSVPGWVALPALLVGSIVVFRLWSPSGVAVERPRPTAKTASQKVSPQEEAYAGLPSATSGHSSLGTALIAGSEPPETAFCPNDLSYGTPRKLETTGPPKTTAPRNIAPVALAAETLADPILAGLLRDTKDPVWKVRWDAVNELGKLKDRRAIAALVARALYDDNPHPRWRSLWALKAVDPNGSQAVPLLRTDLANETPVVARNAAIALAFFEWPEGRYELLKGLEDSDLYRRWEAIFSLRKIGNPDVAEALVPHLNQETEPEVRIRGEVALALGYMGTRSVIPPLLDAVSEDQSSQVRWRAAMTLAKVGDTSVTEELERTLTTEEDPQVRKHIEDALEKIEKRTGKSK